MILSSYFGEGVDNQTLNGDSCTADNFNVKLTDPNNTAFLIVLVGGANYAPAPNNNQITKGISVIYFCGESNPISGNVSLDDAGQFKNIKFLDYHATLLLNTTSFNDCVRMGGAITEIPLKGDIYLNSEVEIPGFKDKTGKLYVFEKFID